MKLLLLAPTAVFFAVACARPTPKTVSAPVVAAAKVRDSVVAVQQASPKPVPVAAPAPVVQPAVADTARLSQTDVTRRVADLFGDTTMVGPAPVDSAEDGAPSWDIEVRSYESTERVEHYVRLFSGPAKEHMKARLERGTRYEPMIRAKMRDGGLPEDMYYLALIESDFDPNAYSRAAAVGMWQFMTSTARDMGMRVDWWIDERRDPVRSTSAAVRFIKDLKEQFGSLYLAAAAYNGGPGRVARGLTRYADDLEGTSGDDLFFALADKNYLRNETREYVPQLIAAALIAKEPERYGMSFNRLPELTYDSVRVGPGTPLAAIAHAAGTDVAQLKTLNPQILRGMTPPKDSLTVRIPDGSAEGFNDAFAALPKSERVGLATVVSKKGDRTETIATRTGISARQLAIFNPKLKRLKSGKLVPGQTVLVPTAAVAVAALAVPDPSIERYPSSRSKTIHVVKSGETLGGIAKKYHTTTAVLMKANGLRRALIFPGQSLVVRGTSKSAPKKSTVATKSKKKGTGAAKRSARSDS
jgi:membrane-bound lytic murein transglycosylase D